MKNRKSRKIRVSNLLILSVISLLFLSVSSVSVLAVCLDIGAAGPSAITSDTQICAGIHSVNSPSISVPVIDITQDDVVLNCSGAVVQGSGSGVGIRVGPVSNVTIIDCIIDPYDYALWLDGTNDSLFKNLTLNNSLKANIMINNSATNNTFRNNTIFEGPVGINLTDTTGNLFYYNIFMNHTVLHAYAENSGNHFNIVVGGKARGNYWDDIIDNSLEMYDTDYDTFADSGPDYPYSFGSGGNVSLNIVDFGPMTGMTGFPPSMRLRGINGTLVTPSRNVYVEMLYDKYVNSACRWANDDPFDLISQSWEPCTTVKAWILSEGEGNKTVFAEVKKTDSTTDMINDSIIYRFMQDFTQPFPPLVYDGLTGPDIDWWNSNDTLAAHWFNATEDISIIRYLYRIWNSTDCIGSCAFIDAGDDDSALAAGLDLLEGENYSFEIVAYNPSGLNATPMFSDGVTIDITDPETPAVTSVTHPVEGTAYPLSKMIVNFTSDDPISGGVASGIAGYSYVLDTFSGTAPDNIADSRYWETLSPMLRGTFSQDLKKNGTGPAYAVMSQVRANFTAGEKVRVRVALAEKISDTDDLMGLRVFLARTDGSIPVFGIEADNISTVADSFTDIRYVGNMALAHVYEFDLDITQTIDDDGSNDIYAVVSGITGDDDNRNGLAIGGTTDPAVIDNTTGAYICPEPIGNTCTDDTLTADYSIEVLREDSGDDWTVIYDYLGDGNYYFHVKAVDNAGNWGDTAHFKAVVAGAGAGVAIISPVDREHIPGKGETNITVRVQTTGKANVSIVSYQGVDVRISPDEIVYTTHDFDNITVFQGITWLYAVAVTDWGAVSYSPLVRVIVAPGFGKQSNKTLKITYDGGCGNIGGHICNKNEPPYDLGFASEEMFPGNAVADTSRSPFKIYFTDEFDKSRTAVELGYDDFMDQENPAFGINTGFQAYMLRHVLRYDDVNLEGDFRVPAGTYQLFMRKSGETIDGKYNVTLSIT